MTSKASSALYGRIREILESARAGAARSVNTTQVIANWLIGREIVEEEQEGKAKAAYGERLLAELSGRLRAECGNGYSVDNLELFRRFYGEYPTLISDALPRKFSTPQISDALRRKSPPAVSGTLAFGGSEVRAAMKWRPGMLHPNLSWTHYRTLLRVEKPDARSFYEIEAIRNNWSARELERQINPQIAQMAAEKAIV